MRGLAEYAMSGRRQAATIAILFGLIPLLNLLSGAVVALITLRKGLQEGVLVLLWALLPASLHWLAGDSSPVFMLSAAVVLGQVLRSSQSWPTTLQVAVLLGVVLQLSLRLQPAYVASLESLFSQMLAEGRELPLQGAGGSVPVTPQEMVALLLRFYGAGHVLVIAACVMVARYWQAMLYNPGGFGQEFRSLRFDPRLMILLGVLILGGMAEISILPDWVPLLCILPLLAGLAVAHHVAAVRQMGVGMLVAGYAALLLLAPVMAPAIVLLGLVDGVIDIRKRLTK